MKNEFKGTPTTRMYPRTLEEAFPNDSNRAEWFYPPEKNRSIRNIGMAIAAMIFWILAIYFLTAP